MVAADNMYPICRKTSCFSCGECQLIVDRGLTVKKNGDIVCITKQQSRKEDMELGRISLCFRGYDKDGKIILTLKQKESQKPGYIQVIPLPV